MALAAVRPRTDSPTLALYKPEYKGYRMGSGSTESRWLRVAVGTVVLLAAALVPSPFERRPGWARFGPDKLLHFLGYAWYAAVLADALSAGRSSDESAAVLAVLGSTVNSLVIGRIQQWVPGRRHETADVLAGLIGAILAVTAWYADGRRSARIVDRSNDDG